MPSVERKKNMSSFLMSYPHVQGSMGTGYEPKFPPSEDYHHLHHQYGSMNGLTTSANHMDYSSYHNGYNYSGYGAPSPSGPFYHHPHPPYGSPQMHHPTNASSPNNITQQSNSYVTNAISNNNSTSVGNRNNSNGSSGGGGGGSGGGGASIVNGLNLSENTPNVDSIGYYNNYYANTNGHHHDLPLQCPTTEPPANTALGLQELGNKISPKLCVKYI